MSKYDDDFNWEWNDTQVEMTKENREYDKLNAFNNDDKVEILEKALLNKTKKSKIKVTSKKDIKDETIEARISDHLKPFIFIEKENKLFYMYDKKLAYYKFISTDELISLASSSIEQLELYKYQKQSVYESCAKTMVTDFLRDNDNHIELDRACITANLELNSFYNKTVHLKFEEDINDSEGVCIRIYPSDKENNSCIYSPVEIPLEFITDEKGNKFNGDFKIGSKYKYTPDMKKDGMYSKFISSPWEDELHFKAARMLEGGWLTAIQTNISPIIQSGGGTGKTEQVNIKRATFPGMYMDYDAESNDQFNNDGIQGVPNLIVDESGESMNEKNNKKLSGNSQIAINRKFLGKQQFSTNWTYMSFYINRTWKSKDQGDSIERRYFYIHQNKKPKTVIEGIGDIIIKGKKTRENGKWVRYENDLYSCFAHLMRGALEVFDLGRFPVPADFGGSVVDFNNKMFANMINIKSFFAEFNFDYAPKKKMGITHTELYNMYKMFMEESGTKPKSREAFLISFEDEFNKRNKNDTMLTKTRLKHGFGYPIVINNHYHSELNDKIVSLCLDKTEEEQSKHNDRIAAMSKDIQLEEIESAEDLFTDKPKVHKVKQTYSPKYRRRDI